MCLNPGGTIVFPPYLHRLYPPCLLLEGQLATQCNIAECAAHNRGLIWHTVRRREHAVANPWKDHMCRKCFLVKAEGSRS